MLVAAGCSGNPSFEGATGTGGAAMVEPSTDVATGGGTGSDPVPGDDQEGSTATGGTFGSHPCAGGVLIDDLEDATTYDKWRTYDDGTGTMSPSGAFTAESSADGGSLAVHISGSGFTTWGGGIGRDFDASDDCVARSTGFRFRAKGPGVVTVAAPVTAVVPTSEGGSCDAAEDCNNAHETQVTLSAEWREYTVQWDSLAQADGWGLMASFDRREVLELLFTARPDQQPFDYWIDDLALVDGGDTDSDTGDIGGIVEGCALDPILGEDGFLDWYSARRDPFYTYDDLCKALESFPAFATSGSEQDRKREVAAFFANVSRETGELEYVEQIVKDPPTYYGRGPLQLTHSYNYDSAGTFLGEDLLGNPDLLATDGVLTWAASLWFWMESDGAGKGTCHGAITGGDGFGQTIDIINGGFECNGPNEAAQQRIEYYEQYTADLGVSPGSNLTCW